VPLTGVNDIAFRCEAHVAVTALVLLAELGRDVPGEMSTLGS
jgi:hypothetical protein